MPMTQGGVRTNGHAIECRICAEDPDSGFLPATGSIRLLRAPAGEHVRFENALEEGQRITADFDPMLAKLVVWGRDRGEATDRMVAALKQLTILGLRTNIDYLARVLETKAFRDGALHTGFVTEHADALSPAPVDEHLRDRILIAAALGQRTFRDAIAAVGEPYASMAGWRN